MHFLIEFIMNKVWIAMNKTCSILVEYKSQCLRSSKQFIGIQNLKLKKKSCSNISYSFKSLHNFLSLSIFFYEIPCDFSGLIKIPSVI